MKFVLKPTKNKENSIYKSIYIKEHLVKEIDKIAMKYNTSFNNVLISMIEQCIGEQKD